MREKRKTHEMLVKHKTANVDHEEEQEDEPVRKKLENASESDLKVHHMLLLFTLYYYFLKVSSVSSLSFHCFLSQVLVFAFLIP